MGFKAAIFDLDGTLLDTLKDIAQSVNMVLMHLGKPPIALDEYRYLVGEGAKKLIERALGKDISKANEALLLFKKFYATRWHATTKVYDGIESMLKDLEDSNVRLGILSNKPDDFVQECVKYYFPNISFSYIAGQKEGIKRKPDPAGAFKALEALHVKASEACFVGDTKTDMQTAKNANIKALGVAWGFRDEKELFAHGALEVFQNPKALKEYILTQN